MSDRHENLKVEDNNTGQESVEIKAESCEEANDSPCETNTTNTGVNTEPAPQKIFTRRQRSILPVQIQEQIRSEQNAQQEESEQNAPKQEDELKTESVSSPDHLTSTDTASSASCEAEPKKQKVKLKKPRQPMSHRKIIFYSFLIPFVSLAFAYAVNNFYPIGNKTPLTIDLYHQYAPFLAQLRDKILAGESLFYSWKTGLGTNFYAQLAYYSASPFNLILPLFPPEFLSEAVTVLTLLKIGSIGATSAFMFLNMLCPAKMRTIGDGEPKSLRYTSQVGTDYIVIALSTAFALSGFMLSYSWDIMWLDAIIFLPLLLTGQYRLLTEGKFALYVLSLAACITVNYYIALFICIFTALYFFVSYFSFESDSLIAQKHPLRHFLARGLQFAAASLLGALISAFMAVPTFLALQMTSATSDAFPASIQMNFSIFKFLQRQLIAVEPAIREGLPNVYVGVFIFLIVPLYVFIKEIKMKEKLWHLGLLFFMFISFSNNYLDFIWHGTHYPNQLPFRYAFVYSILLLIISFRTLTYVRTLPKKLIAGTGVAAVLYAILAEEVLKDDIGPVPVYLSILFFVLYVALFAAFRKSKGLHSFRNVSFALAMILVTELMVNTVFSVVYIHKNEYYTSRPDFNNDFTSMRSEISALEEKDPGFWRMEMIQQKTTNSPALYGYRGITLFSSTSLENTAKLMRKLGFHGNNINSYKYMAATDFANALLGVKYLINKDTAIRDPELLPLKEEGGLHVYENPYALPLGFMVDESIFTWDTLSDNPFTVQNNFITAAGLHGQVFESREIKDQAAGNYSFSSLADQGLQASVGDGKLSGSIEFSLIPEKDEHLYFFLNVSAETQVDMTILDEEGKEEKTVADGAKTTNESAPLSPIGTENRPESTTVQDNRSINTREIIDCGFVRKGQKVKVKLTTKEDKSRNISIYAAASNQEQLEKHVAEWKKAGLDITSFSENAIYGKVNAPKDGRLFLTIPFDSSWCATVDGQNVEPVHVANGFMAIAVSAGEHEIALEYMPPAFDVAVLASASGLVLFILALIVREILEKRRMKAKKAEIE